VLLDSYLANAVEVDVDALSDGRAVHVAGIMEHIEEAGVHSGDSACSLPPHSLSPEIVAELEVQTRAMALALGVVGLMNVQFAIKDGEIYVLEVNPRASRTVPFVAKATDSAIASIAARLMAGEPLSNFPQRPPYPAGVGPDTPLPLMDPMTLADPVTPWFSVKEAVMPFNRFPGVDPLLGPEMRSTGEVMGWDRTFPLAFLKAQMGAGMTLPENGRVFVSIKDADKTKALAEAARGLVSHGLRDRRDPRHRRLARRGRRAVGAREQGLRGPAEHRRPAEERRDRAGDEHHRGQPGRRGQPRHPGRRPLRQASPTSPPPPPASPPSPRCRRGRRGRSGCGRCRGSC
jgi:carbamoyl-phosphate synthase large subunit